MFLESYTDLELGKQAELAKMKRLATSLLLLVTLIYVLASLYVDQFTWVGFVAATAEAAMVGAIADWFAVTALFRHPLGVKIPHTAIIPSRKKHYRRSIRHICSTELFVGRSYFLKNPIHAPESACSCLDC